MTKTSKKTYSRLLPAALILFILFAATFPFVAGLTYSGRSESPDHILTYTKNKLTWDSGTKVDANGVAQLSAFEAKYDNAAASDGSNIVAPGTTGYDIVRLKNSIDGSIKYTAVLYSIKTSDDLAVESSLSGSGFSDTSSYPLPDGVKNNDVVRAVSGTLGGGQIQDFDIDWIWEYTDGTDADAVDTALGDKAAEGSPDDVTVGIYIVVEDNNSYIKPTAPKTGDTAFTGVYYTLFALSAVTMIILFFIGRRRDKEEEEKPCES